MISNGVPNPEAYPLLISKEYPAWEGKRVATFEYGVHYSVRASKNNYAGGRRPPVALICYVYSYLNELCYNLRQFS